MRLGVAIPDRIVAATGQYDSFADVAREIEAVGFDSAWMYDAISRGTAPHADPLTVLAVAATATSLQVGTSILAVPLRHPVELANRILTTQVAAKGRLIVGVGTGSTAIDYAALGADFAGRFDVLESSLETMKRLFRGEQVGDAKLNVFPGCEGGPPIYIGAWKSKKWIRLAAERYDGWISSVRYGGWAGLEEGLAFYRSCGGERAIAANVRIDARKPESSDEPVLSEALSLDEARGVLRRVADMGFDEANIRAVAGDREELEAIRSLI